MESISGGYSWDFSSTSSTLLSLISNGAEAAASTILGAVTYGVLGTLIGGTQSGANGGLLGFGLIANGVGAIVGVIAGAVGGGIYGLAQGWDATTTMMNETWGNMFDGTFVPWAHS